MKDDKFVWLVSADDKAAREAAKKIALARAGDVVFLTSEEYVAVRSSRIHKFEI
jgi:hypothetical protein